MSELFFFIITVYTKMMINIFILIDNLITNISSFLSVFTQFGIISLKNSESPNTSKFLGGTHLPEAYESHRLESADFSYLAPEFFLAAMLLFLFTYGIFMKRSKYNFNIPEEFTYFTLLILFYTLLITSKILSFESQVLFQGVILIDPSVTLVKLFCIFVSILCLVISSDYLTRSRLGCFEFFILFMISIFGIMFFVSSMDLFCLFLSLEIQSICFYALIAINRNSGSGVESGLKYFVLGAFSSGVLLFGISLIYGSVGTVNMLSIFHHITGLGLGSFNFSTDHLTNPFVHVESKLVLGFLLMFVGFLFKVTAAPFHKWAPDVYDGAPLAIIVFISTVPKIAIFFMLSKFVGFYFDQMRFLWEPLFLVSGALSIVIGTFFAVRQFKFRRFLAYSSITHMGYILIGLSGGCAISIKYSFLYTIAYVIMSLNLWCLVTIMEHNYTQKLESIGDFRGIFYKNKFYGFNLICVLFSLGGFPPFIGFFAKYFLLTGLINSYFYVIVFLVIISSLFSIYYYIRIIKVILFDEKKKILNYRHVISWKLHLVTVFTFLLLFSFYFIVGLFDLADYFMGFLM